jgi:hypothetical protein
MRREKSGNGFTDFMEISFGHPERERIIIHFPVSEELKKSSDKRATARVEIQAGGFTGYAEPWLDVSDFVRFVPQVHQLYETLGGEARFETVENQICLVLKGDGRGHISLIGHLLDRCGDGNKLSFKLNFDQTLLRRSILELERFLKSTANKP